ncbi:sigma-70 family RNA polymerase sigma factor [Streptomyces sp. B6B3]|uniref:sigma-70 family RNA polymerase sigma factor n=1 Tax=Streptomyces sp. B6B3 TaxID=3153570 RepID=UPI00325D140F
MAITTVPAPSSLTDAEVAAGLVRGEEACLGVAYQRWGGLVQALACRALADAREAEDVVQQVFVAAWHGREGYRPDRGPLPSWLVGIARRKIADACAARARRAELVSAAGGALPADGAAAEQPDAVLDRVLLLRELGKLPPAQRRVLCLAFYGELSQAQIAERTGLPLGTVKSHTRRGLRRLRRGLSADPTRP